MTKNLDLHENEEKLMKVNRRSKTVYMIAGIFSLYSCKAPVPTRSKVATDCLPNQTAGNPQQGITSQTTAGQDRINNGLNQGQGQVQGQDQGLAQTNPNSQPAGNEAQTAQTNQTNGDQTANDTTFALTVAAANLTAETDQLWKSTISSMFKEKCDTCHGPITQAPALDSYEAVVTEIPSMTTKVGENSHPADKITEVEKTIFSGWMAFVTETKAAQAALPADQVQDTEDQSESGEDYFTNNLKILVDSDCKSCHNTSEAQEPILETYAQAKANMDAILVTVKKSQGSAKAMPPAAPLSASNLKLFLEWKTAEKKPQEKPDSPAEELIAPFASPNQGQNEAQAEAATGAQEYAGAQQSQNAYGSNPCN